MKLGMHIVWDMRFYFSKCQPLAANMALILGLKAAQLLMMRLSDMLAHSFSMEAMRASTLGWGVAQTFLSILPQISKPNNTGFGVRDAQTKACT